MCKNNLQDTIQNNKLQTNRRQSLLLMNLSDEIGYCICKTHNVKLIMFVNCLKYGRFSDQEL